MTNFSSEYKITIIIPYRNRDIVRVVRSMDSLKAQTNNNFKVIFEDYGSSSEYSKEVKNVLENYEFVSYYYHQTSMLPWNRAHALNIGVKNCTTSYFLPADVDLIFDKSFIEILYHNAAKNKITTFKVAFLKRNNKEWDNTKKMKAEGISPITALGMTLFKKEAFKAVGGYDEKFIYWGWEDNDLVERCIAKGLKHSFFPGKTILFHQWHPRSEISRESYPIGIKGFLRDSGCGNIFQQYRLRGEVLDYRVEDFKNHNILPYRFKMIWDLENVIKQGKKGELFAFIIGPLKNKNRFKKGKQFFLVKTLNSLLKNKNLRLEWKYDEGIYLNYEVRDELLNYSISNLSRFDLLGLEENGEQVKMYLKILKE